MQHQLLSVSNLYANSLYETNHLVEQSKKLDYKEFNIYLTNLIKKRERLEEESKQLEQNTNLVIELFSKEISRIPNIYAYYDKQTITNIFDKAPAWKKIKTLAQTLWISAKKAFSILKISQSQLQAETRNTAWDKFEILENSTKAVKDACKVWLYVWWITLAWPTVGALWEASMIIWWEDLVLEIWEDTANIYYWYNNDLTAIFSDIRTITKPTSAILWITNISQISWDPEEVLDTFIFFGDQILWTVNDNEFIWVNIDSITKNIDINKIPQNEKNRYFKEMRLNTKPDLNNIIKNIIKQPLKQMEDIRTEETTEEKPNNKNQKDAELNDYNIIWEWERIEIVKQNGGKVPDYIKNQNFNLYFNDNWTVLLNTLNKFNNETDTTKMDYIFDGKKWKISIQWILYSDIWIKENKLYLSVLSEKNDNLLTSIFKKKGE